ncbi:MAG: 4-alpha-glucanotransferase [Sedimentisphaerales bacterium]|nr:4-alpha-glucanotransferase [Sedimentisphaerales bacterium]
MLTRRASGVLLPVSCLPGAYGIGDLGPEAHRFADFLARAGQGVWQILPLNPLSGPPTYSPYDSPSAFGGNPLLISPDGLHRQGLLTRRELADLKLPNRSQVDYRRVIAARKRLWPRIVQRFQADRPEGWQRLCREQRDWLEDYAWFVALKEHFGGRLWNDWPAAIRRRQPSELARLAAELAGIVEREKIRQFLFFEQWRQLKQYCNERGIAILGDLPIYVSLDSADVWAHPQWFQLDRAGRPRRLAGVPPDRFSRMGQLWGNPLYDWPRLRQDGYSWWIRRLRRGLTLYDMVRIDHFRGLVGYWSVPAGRTTAATAATGRWMPGPGRAFWDTVLRFFPQAPFVAEDLGQITPDVRELLRDYQLPGMRILQFAFEGDPAGNPYAPHRHRANAVVYTGTHDNNTTRGWFDEELSPGQRRILAAYLGRSVSSGQIAWEMVRLALMSVCRLAIVPAQDLLSLDSSARMNHPARARGNWRWRMTGRIPGSIARRLRQMTELYGRA